MDYKHMCVLDAAGYYATYVLVADGGGAVLYLTDGQILLDALPPSGFVRPKWDGKGGPKAQRRKKSPRGRLRIRHRRQLIRSLTQPSALPSWSSRWRT